MNMSAKKTLLASVYNLSVQKILTSYENKVITLPKQFTVEENKGVLRNVMATELGLQ